MRRQPLFVVNASKVTRAALAGAAEALQWEAHLLVIAAGEGERAKDAENVDGCAQYVGGVYM